MRDSRLVALIDAAVDNGNSGSAAASNDLGNHASNDASVARDIAAVR